MLICRLLITVAPEERGNRHGYIGYDYARDASDSIEQRNADDFSWWPEDDRWARPRAIEIAQEEIDDHIRRGIGGELLSYEILEEKTGD